MAASFLATLALAVEPAPTFLDAWGQADGNGSSGGAAGEFIAPEGVAVGPGGEIFVVESGNDRVQRFDNDGNFIAMWGSEGSGDGEMLDPSGIALDADGNVYVAEVGNHRIQKFDSNGNFIRKWGANGGDGTSGTGDGEFSLPHGVAVHSSGDVYVADTYNHRIQVFDPDGNFLRKWGGDDGAGGEGSAGNGDGEFNRPVRLAFNPDGVLYVAGVINDRVQKFDTAGTFLGKFGTEGSADGQVAGLYGIDVDDHGDVYVTEIDNHRAQKFDGDGNHLTKWGSLTTSWPREYGKFQKPLDIAVDSAGKIFVADTDNHRIQVFGANCSKSISPTSRDHDARETAGTVDVTAADGCEWDAMSNDGFISVTSGASGSGDGAVDYSVSENPDTAAREGTLTIAGETFTVTQAAALIPEAERDALLALYDATNGDGWDDNLNWLGAVGSEDTWHGVTVANNHVTELRLNGNGLSGTIPTELEDLVELRRLSLYENQLTGGVPSELGILPKLEVLDLRTNQLSGTMPAELGDLEELRELDLRQNQLSGAIPSELGSLSKLTKLALSENELTGAIPSVLGSLSNLGFLWLHTNTLTGGIPAEIGSLSNLWSLHLCCNRLDGSVPAQLGNLGSLKFLFLHANQLSGEVAVELGDLDELNDDDSDFRWNALYTDDDALRDFLNAKQDGGDWESTQTIAPSDVAVDDSAPSMPAPRAVTEDSVDVQWSPISYTDDSGAYEALYSKTSGGPYTVFETRTDDKTASSLEVTGLQSGTEYFFVVRTITEPHNDNDNEVTSGHSKEVSAKTTTVCTLSISPESRDHGADNEVGTVDVAAPQGCDWSASSSAGFLTVTSDASGSGDGQLEYSIAANPHPTDREASVTFVMAGQADEVLMVSQAANLFPIPDSERAALIAFYDAMNGDRWRDNNHWLGPEGTEWAWTGVRVEDGHVTNLQLENDLEGTLPASIEDLTELRELHLSGGRVSGGIPGAISRLSHLTSLKLTSLQIDGRIPGHLGRLSQLDGLFLTDNQLVGAIPDELGALTRLRFLSLSGNRLDGSIPGKLGDLPNLAVLALANNEMSGPIPPELANTGIEVLRLNGNRLSGAVPTELVKLKRLFELRLESNRLEGELPDDLQELTRLNEGFTDLRWNALYTDDEQLRKFLNSKQRGGDWESTQTVAPTDVSVDDSPAPLMTKAVAEDAVDLEWTPIDYRGDVGSYEVLYSRTSGGPYTAFDTRTADKSASGLEVTGLDSASTYYFVVRTITEPHSNNDNEVVSGYSEEVSAITQEELPCSLTLSPESGSYGELAVSGSFDVSAPDSCGWSASTAESWIHIGEGTGSGDGQVLFDLGENRSSTTRSGTISVLNQVTGAIRDFAVEQAGFPCVVDVDPAALEVASSGGSSGFDVSAPVDCGWRTERSDTWVTFSGGDDTVAGTGDGVVDFAVDENPSGNDRSMNIDVISDGGERDIVEVRQLGAPCDYSLSRTNAAYGRAATKGQVEVTTLDGCQWDAAANDPWLQIEGASGGTGSGTVGYSVEENGEPESRTGSLTIAGHTFTVTQSAGASDCEFSLSPDSAAIGESGGGGTIGLKTDAECSWIASRQATWISLTSADSGTGSGTISYVVDPNPSAAERTAQITVAGQPVSVSQAGKALNCTYALSATGASVGGSGASRTVDVATQNRCSWAASSGVPWISTASRRRRGSGSASVEVAPIPAGVTERSGMVDIAGRSFTVIQAEAAVDCRVSLSPGQAGYRDVGGSGSVEVSTSQPECPWAATTTAPWIQIRANGSGRGRGILRYRIEANSTLYRRSAVIDVGGSPVPVTQGAMDDSCDVKLSSTSLAFGRQGEAVTVPVQTQEGCAWELTDSPGWVRIRNGSGLGSGTIDLRIRRNGTGGSRGAVLTVSVFDPSGVQTAIRFLEVSQTPVPRKQCEFTLAQSSIRYLSQRAQDASWRAVPVNESGFPSDVCTEFPVTTDVDWIHPRDPVRDPLSTEVVVAVDVDRNNEEFARTGTVSIGGQNVTVNQEGAHDDGCAYRLLPSTLRFDRSAHRAKVEVRSDRRCRWEPRASAPWLRILGPQKGRGNGKVRFRLRANETGSTRTATITVGATTATIIQEAEEAARSGR